MYLPTLHRHHLKGCVTSVLLSFRFDKSSRNFSIRKFHSTIDPILDPVAVAVSCIHRADLLIPAWEPIAAFRTLSNYSFLCDSHGSTVMQKTCIWAYPNPKHKATAD
jgi:hypothetical protein